jgi:acyl-CoA synthetase (AMP-forming)/AMP-acid ligase II
MLTHTNIVANIIQGDHKSLVVDEKEKIIGILPFFHIYALYVFLGCGLSRGCCTIVLPRFDLPKFLSIIQEHKITRAHVVPPIVLALAKHPMVDKYDLSSLKSIMSAAAPLSKELSEACQKRLKISINQGYGSKFHFLNFQVTELSPLVAAQFDNKAIAGGTGLLVSNIEARIIDMETQKDLGYDKEGELLIKGPNVMKGYLGNDEATKYTIKDGWLYTGDIAKIEKATQEVFILDRVKELIKYKGYQVPPAELEGIISTHPSVADCAVIGIPDDEVGEIPKAFIVLKKDEVVDAEAIMEFVESKVAPQKKIRLVSFVESIPKSSSGKILRRVLRDSEIKK